MAAVAAPRPETWSIKHLRHLYVEQKAGVRSLKPVCWARALQMTMSSEACLLVWPTCGCNITNPVRHVFKSRSAVACTETETCNSSFWLSIVCWRPVKKPWSCSALSPTVASHSSDQKFSDFSRERTTTSWVASVPQFSSRARNEIPDVISCPLKSSDLTQAASSSKRHSRRSSLEDTNKRDFGVLGVLFVPYSGNKFCAVAALCKQSMHLFFCISVFKSSDLNLTVICLIPHWGLYWIDMFLSTVQPRFGSVNK